MVSSVWPVGTALVLAGVAVVLRCWSRRGAWRPRHAGGSGPAARGLAVLRLEPYFREERPTVELIGWPLVDPDEQPHLFAPAVPGPVVPSVVPAAAEAAAAAGTAPGTGVAAGAGEAGNVESGLGSAAEQPDPVVMGRVLAGLRRLQRP
ncbi:hypothetical protein SAMN04487904_107193 [Actinopolyspora lacussalsi subsp. righensis]|uniref:Uncharacterized protein n=1 Tax=Actinopolyspora righensis TaxID=995060 RepID=A0A1I7ALC7_9ACTN|nr:hypothetical protein [Actinopolyspora righensis]SFT75779.1 hypothetical protein SAMN04487904_107193 [Actinopolyspora righensis]